jgi:hypothetical protein
MNLEVEEAGVLNCPRKPCDMAHHLFSSRQPRRVANAWPIRELPHEVVGDQRLLSLVVCNERLEVLLQEIGRDRHRNLLFGWSGVNRASRPPLTGGRVAGDRLLRKPERLPHDGYLAF